MFKKFKIRMYDNWSPTTKLMFYLAILAIFIALFYGGSKLTQVHFGSGDNVAGDKIINQEQPVRHIDQNWIAHLNNNLPKEKNKPIEIRWVNGDLETFRLSEEMEIYLESEGWDVFISMSSYATPPIGGADFKHLPDKIEIIIGVRP